jgi:hypothetical protein
MWQADRPIVLCAFFITFPDPILSECIDIGETSRLGNGKDSVVYEYIYTHLHAYALSPPFDSVVIRVFIEELRATQLVNKFHAFFICLIIFPIFNLRLTFINYNNLRYWFLNIKYVCRQAISEIVFYFFKTISRTFANVYLKIHYLFRPIFVIFRLYSIGNINQQQQQQQQQQQ